MSTSLMPEARQRYYNNNGSVAAGCKLYLYAAGTSTPKVAYTDSAGLVPHAHPITLDSKGEALIYFSGAYKVDLKTAAGVQITGYPVDNYVSFNAMISSSESAILAMLAAPNGSGLSGYIPGNANAVATDVEEKLRRFVDLKDYNVVGDNVADDTVALQAVLDSDVYEFDGLNKTYYITAGLTSTKSHKLKNMKLRGISGAAARFLTFNGVQGTAQALSANVSAKAYSVSVSDGTAFLEGGWLFLRSDADYSPTVASKTGELCRIKSVVGNTLTMYDPIMAPYTTATSATASPVQMIESVEFENLEIIGTAGASQQVGIEMYLCGKINSINLHTSDFQNTHLNIIRCGVSRIYGGGGNRSGVPNGFNYGVVFARGCYDSLVIGYSGNDLRHAISVGGSEGISRNVRGYHCTASGSIDAGFDSHAQAMWVDYSHNIVICSADAGLDSDGIICQAPNFKAIGNTIINPKRNGIFHQPSVNGGVRTTCQIAHNRGETNQPESDAVFVSIAASSGSDIDSVTLDDNVGEGWPSLVMVYAKTNNIKWATVKNLVPLTDVTAIGIQFRADTGLEISGGEISGVKLTASGAATESVYLRGVGTGIVKNITIRNCNTSGLGIGLRLLSTDNIRTDGTCSFTNTTPYSIVTSTSFRSAELNAPITISASTYTLAATDKRLIAANAGTVTLTLPLATSWAYRKIRVSNTLAQLMISSSANVKPIIGGALATAILPATAGAWADLESDGTDWNITARG